MLGKSASWWDAAMLVSLAVAAVIAVVVALATTGSVKANKREAAIAKAELERYKIDASKQILDAQADAAHANARALEAQLELVKFRNGRSLSSSQREILRELLNISPKGPVIIKPNFLSAEPSRYAREISEVFNASGFHDVGDKPLSVVSTVLPGIFLVVLNGEHHPIQLEGIAKAFKAANIPFTMHSEPYVPDDKTVVILIGEQP